MRILILIILLNCVQVRNESGKNENGAGEKELAILITSQSKVSVDVNVTSTGDVPANQNNGNTGNPGNTGNTGNTGNIDSQQFMRYTFKVIDYNNSWINTNAKCSENPGYRMASLDEYIVYVKLLDYVRLNYSRVSNEWQSLWYTARWRGSYNYWISDRNFLSSDDLGYVAGLRIGDSLTAVVWDFQYDINYVYNKNYERGIFGLCYKLN